MNKSAQRKPTSFDVARLAGVSRSAVSRAFTPGANISPEMREKVTKAADELGYRVNSLARGLQQKHSGIVGLVTSRLDTPLRSNQVRLLSEALIREGFKPMLLTVERPEDLGRLIESLLGLQRRRGSSSPTALRRGALIEDCRRLGLPVVLVNRAGSAKWGDRVVADIDAAGQLAVDMLERCGAARLACLTPRKQTYSVSGRANAFVSAARERNLSCLIIHTSDQGYDEAREAIVQLNRAGIDGFDALFCATDLLALGALDGLRLDLGVRVPEDIQVLGFDDIEQAAWGAYDLSTIRQDAKAQAEAVLELLTDRIADNTLPNRVHRQDLLPIYRGTTRNGG